MSVFVCSSIYRSLSIPKYERFAPNYFAWDPKKGLINNFWHMFIIYWTTRTLIGDNGTLRHSSLEFKVNFCQDKIFAKEILWKVKRSKISTNSPYISNVLRLLKLFDNRQKLKDNQREQSSIFKHQIPPQLKSIKITGLDSWHCKLTIAGIYAIKSWRIFIQTKFIILSVSLLYFLQKLQGDKFCGKARKVSLSLWRSLRSIHAMLSSIKQDYLSKRKQNCDEYNFCPKLPVGPRTSDSSDGLGSLYSVLKKGYFARLKASYNGHAHSPAFLHLNAWKGHVPLIRVCML